MTDARAISAQLVDHMRRYSISVAGCWIWSGALDSHGYGVINIGGTKKAHRVSWIAFNGPIPEGMSVLHKCDVPSCINPNHLFLGTQADNMADMIAKGRDRKAVGDNHPSRRYPELRRGINNSRARLSEADIEAIRSSPMGCRKLAKLYGISVTHACNIRNRKAWGHI
jgi:hypothetical protein